MARSLPETPPPESDKQPESGPRESDIRELRVTPERREYDAIVDDLTWQIIYNQNRLSEGRLQQEIEKARRLPALEVLESERLELASLLELLHALEAHERGNAIFMEDWQDTIKAIAHQQGSDNRPDQLTREEVGHAFQTFPDRQRLLKQEELALAHYERLLELSGDSVAIVLMSNGVELTIPRTDIEATVNDLQVRIAERIENPDERRERLEKLDDDLQDIIERVSAVVDEAGKPLERGKAYELQEIYLLRKLIHGADRGHVASVEHGTLREDISRRHGSVDFSILAAGERLPFQVKTFNRGAGVEARAKQQDVLRRASQSHADTPVVVLEGRNVQGAYEKSSSQDPSDITRTDKFNALQPILDAVPEKMQPRLLAVLGLTSEDMAEERKVFEEKQQARKELETERQESRAEREKRLATFEAEQRAKEEALEERRRMKELDAERARTEREANIRRHQEEMARTSHERQAQQSAAARQHQVLVQTRAKEALQRLEEQKAEAARLEMEEAKKAKRREALAAKRREAGDWPPVNLKGLATSDTLKRLNMLSPDWRGDASALLAAKKEFFRTYGQPKKGATEALDTDRPNAAFRNAFATRNQFEGTDEAESDMAAE